MLRLLDTEALYTVIGDVKPMSSAYAYYKLDTKFSQKASERMAREYAAFYAPYGVTASTPPMDIALLIENDPTTARNRGLGYLYGYPKHAVDFFVSAADEQGETKKFVKRDFLRIPTFESAGNRFV